jgi:hypothetical protein
MERDLSSVQALVAGNQISERYDLGRQGHQPAVAPAGHQCRGRSEPSRNRRLRFQGGRRRNAQAGRQLERHGREDQQGTARAQEIVENGLQSTIKESASQLADVSTAAATIGKLRDNFEDMSQYYKTRFAIVIKHNEDLVRDIAEALGQSPISGRRAAIDRAHPHRRGTPQRRVAHHAAQAGNRELILRRGRRICRCSSSLILERLSRRGTKAPPFGAADRRAATRRSRSSCSDSMHGALRRIERA